MIIWLNGTHGVGKTTTSALVAARIPGARVLDPEKVGETLMDVRPPLPDLGDFQHWPPWRPLVVETARRLHGYAGGTLVLPQTVLVREYWHEIRDGFRSAGIPLVHVVLHADEETLLRRIDEDTVMGPSTFRRSRVAQYGEAFDAWLADEAHVIDTTGRAPEEVADEVVLLA